VDWTQTFRLDLRAGEEYLIDVHLVSFAIAVNPEDALAIADFFTADHYGAAATLASADPAASIAFIPEPAGSLLLFAPAVLLPRCRRRRRHRRRL
jgi:hypothetical protein